MGGIVRIRETGNNSLPLARQGWGGFAAVFVITLLCALFSTTYVSHELPGYYWDYSLYPIWLDHLTDLLRDGNWVRFVRTIGGSIRSSDYNVSPLLLLIPFSYVFGKSRLVYILLNVVIYLIPASVILTYLLKECWREYGRGISFAIGLTCVLLYPMFWAPTLRGYPDISALIPMGLAGIIILRTQWMVRASALESVGVGVLLWCTFLIRRHFAFTVLSIILVTLIFSAVLIIREESEKKTLFKRFVRNAVIVGAAMVVPALVFQGPLINRILTTSYRDIYAAYQLGFSEKLLSIYERNGPVWIGLVALGTGYCLYLRNLKVVYCLCVGVISYTLFQRTQAPYIHHTLPFAFWMAPVAGWPLVLINAQARPVRRAGYSALLIGLLTAVSLPSLAWESIRSSPLLTWSKTLQAKQKFPPFRIKSYQALVKLSNELDSPEYMDKTILVLASSYELNPSILENINPSLIPRIKGSGNVDLRDGFALETALNADYIITTSDPALHLPEEHQQVVVIPSRALLDPKNPLARSFTKLPNRVYRLADGTTAYILKRTSTPSDEAVDWLLAEFRKHYPSWQVNAGMIGPDNP